MNKLETLLAEPKGNKPLFMAHMIAGFPSVSESAKVGEALVEGGADIIEIQIPFSDPMADGATISVACQDALAKGATVESSLKLVERIAKFGKPIAVMSYVNLVFRFGFLEFAKTIQKTGASALIVPDCPFDAPEGRELLAACREADIFLIPVVSPGVPAERLQTLAKDASGFVYCTTRQGITGATSNFAKDLTDFATLAKQVFNLPLAVGFGVKSRADVESLSKIADIVIAGSVFVDTIRNGKSVATKIRTLTA